GRSVCAVPGALAQDDRRHDRAGHPARRAAGPGSRSLAAEPKAPSMSDFTWYSRLAVWAGLAVLLVQSVTGRGVGIMTALAVIAPFSGLIAFLGGLARAGGFAEDLFGGRTAALSHMQESATLESPPSQADSLTARTAVPVAAVVSPPSSSTTASCGVAL